MTPKVVIDRSTFPTADDEYTPAQRRIIDARLEKALDEVKRGHTAGPFDTADEMIASLKQELHKAARKAKQARRPMRVDYNNPRVVRQLRDAPPNVRKAFLKQTTFLAADLHHPSLRAKKYDERRDLWQARATKDWWFYFVIQNDTCIVPHP